MYVVCYSTPGTVAVEDDESLGAHLKVWVPGTRLASCDLLIFVDEAGESVAPAHAGNVASWSLWERA